jgi:cobalt/nickel transport protein
MKRANLLLLATVLVLSVIPLLLPVPDGMREPFPGADDQGKAAVVASHPDYKPWFTPLWEPPSEEIVNLMFALQGALGAGLLAYYIGLKIGLKRGQAQGRQRASTDAPD